VPPPAVAAEGAAAVLDFLRQQHTDPKA
jgi:hypothetical protein